MQTSERLLAQRYAQAFYEACAQGHAEERGRQELAQVWKAIQPRLRAFLHPLVTPADRKKLLKELVGEGLLEATFRFLEILIDRKRVALLPLVVQNFDKILDLRRGVVKAQVRCALPLDARQQERLRQGLERFAGKTVQLDVRESPELVGGFVIKLGDWVLDRSFAGALSRMKESLAA